MTRSQAVAAVLIAMIIIGGPVSCAIHENRELTRRVDAACNGDLNEAARAIACVSAVNRRPAR